MDRIAILLYILANDKPEPGGNASAMRGSYKTAPIMVAPLHCKHQ